MAITLTTADVKRKAMIDSSNTDYDSTIGSLISEMQPALENSIADRYLADTSDANLQAALKLGMLEIITGEFLEQMRREVGNAEQFSIAGVSIGAPPRSGPDLMQQGSTRLQPYLKALPAAMSDTASSSTTPDDDTVFSVEEEVW